MGDVNLVVEGLKFMVLGMTTVFLFLMLMVFVLNVISGIVKKYFPSKKVKPLHVRNQVAANSDADDEEIVAVITASIEQFRKH